MKLLQKFSLLRGEVMSAEFLQSYSRALAEEFADDADAIAVLDRLVKRGRGEYEPKIPELGALLDMVRAERKSRLDAAVQKRRVQEWEEHKARCQREWEEDQAEPREKSEIEMRLEQILAAARKPREQERYPPPSAYDRDGECAEFFAAEREEMLAQERDKPNHQQRSPGGCHLQGRAESQGKEHSNEPTSARQL